MLDVSLFKRPAFLGVQAGTFAIGAGMFALFPFLSIYLQDILGYSPLGAGLRFLPITVFVFFVPIATRKIAARVPMWALLSGEPRDRCARRDPDGGHLARLELAGAASGLHRRRARHRAREPDDRGRGASGRRSGAHGHGFGHQQHVPARRPRDGRRGVRRGAAGARRASPHRRGLSRQGARVGGQLVGSARGRQANDASRTSPPPRSSAGCGSFS